MTGGASLFAAEGFLMEGEELGGIEGFNLRSADWAASLANAEEAETAVANLELASAGEEAISESAAADEEANIGSASLSAAGTESGSSGVSQSFLPFRKGVNYSLDTVNDSLGTASVPSARVEIGLAAEGGGAEQVQLTKQDSIGGSWGVRGDSGQMRPIGGLETGPSSISIHGNSAMSPQTAYLYRLEDANTGAHLKWGITDDPSPYGRYTSDFMEGKRMIFEDQGPRSLMLQIERDMIEIDPGPLNKEPWAGRGLR